jgi:hypothetical protein
MGINVVEKHKITAIIPKYIFILEFRNKEDNQKEILYLSLMKITKIIILILKTKLTKGFY